MATRPTSGPAPSNGRSACPPGPPPPGGGSAPVPPAGLPRFTEPEMRRWPHPLEIAPPPAPATPSEQAAEAALAELTRSLARQTQLMAEMKALLEELSGRCRPPENP